MVQLTDRLARLCGKVAILSAAEWYLVTKVIDDRLPAFVFNHILSLSIVINFILFSVYGLVIYPLLFSPLRHLPKVSQHGSEVATIVMESPRGKTPLGWIDQFPDADLIHVQGAFNVSSVMPVTPNALRDVMNTNPYDFEKPWGVRAFLARVIGFGLILSEGAAHKKQRKALTPAFHIRKIRELYGIMWEKTGTLLKGLQDDIYQHPASAKYGDKWGSGAGMVEVSEWGSRLTLDIIGATAMGHEFESLTHEANPVAHAFLEILEPKRDLLMFFVGHFLLPEWLLRILPVRPNEMMDRNCSYLRGLCLDIVKGKHVEMQKGEKGRDYDILRQIMSTNEFTDSELVDQMLTFLAAGHETTAAALTWTTFLMAHNPSVQEKLRAEVREYIPSSDSPVTSELLESMPYLNGVCEETLRLYPTVPTTIREAVRDTTVAGVSIPRDTLMLIVPYAINRNPAAWGTDANEIVPERWIDIGDDGKGRPNKNGGAPSNFNDITFLHGQRACIGRDFAKAELRCAVAGVVGKFHMEMELPDEEIRIAGVVTTKPVQGMKLIMKPIEGW